MIKAVVGANWGDEGKGKITDMLAKEADSVEVTNNGRCIKEGTSQRAGS